MLKWLAGIIGDTSEAKLKKLEHLVVAANDREEDVQPLTDAELRARTDQFRQRLADGEELDDVLPDAFAVVREMAYRRLGERHYDVQLLGGIVLHQGKIAEMKTGEGKTLVATLPAVPERPGGLGCAPDYRQRLPGQARHPVDGPHLPHPGPLGRLPSARFRLPVQPRLQQR